MGIFSSDPEKVAQREADRAAAGAAAQEAKAARDRSRAEAAFRTSPAGHARTSFKRGDHIFQTSFNLEDVQSFVVWLDNAYTQRKAHDPTDVLNSVAREGWNFVSMSTAFVHEGEDSRDKFMMSGQQTAVRGRLVGTYVFVRST